MKELSSLQRVLPGIAEYAFERYQQRATLEVTSKGHPADWVTEVDLEVQRRIMKFLAKEYADDAIMGEELGLDVIPDDPDGRCWVIDPIDGTRNFVRGMFPAFGVSVAFTNKGQVEAGVVVFPGTGDLYSASRGEGAHCNGKRIRVSTVATVALSRVEVDFGIPKIREQTLRQFGEIILEASQVDSHCAAVVALCSTAAGEMDGFFHVTLNPWDYAAGILIIEEAGGRVSRLDGSPLNLFDGRPGVLATNGAIHDEALNMITPA